MIPTVESLKSSRMTHHFGDVYNPPALTNFMGCVQAEIDPVAIRSHNFPPFNADPLTARLFWDDKIFGATGSAVHLTWYPDRIEREAEFGEFRMTTVTSMAVGRMGTIVKISVQNRAASPRTARFKLVCRGGVTKSVKAWREAYAPTESDNEVHVKGDCGAILHTAQHSAATVAQGAFPKPKEVTPWALHFEFELLAGETKSVAYASALAETAADALTLLDDLRNNADAEIARATAHWNAELRAAFTPGNDRFSGFMPTLETSDPDVLKNYHMGVLGTIYFKRDTPHSVYGRAYSTVMPRYWSPVSFLWDYSLSSVVHALMDPAEMKSALERWMKLDIHKHFGTDYLTGSGIGPWYAINDYAMTLIARDYLKYSGDFPWLDSLVGGTKVIDYLHRYATNWKKFKTSNGLADYGGLLNLLECVASYVHEVASMNAANAFSLRSMAEILDLRGNAAEARSMRGEALGIIRDVNGLYLKGKGYWNCRHPDGTTREVRHCYDLLSVLNHIPDDLTADQKREMTDFFKRELQTKTWMIALSPGDDDCVFDIRADHQWTGAYTAWPPMTALGLYKIGQGAMAFDWYKSLARSANQGPYAQAHIADGIMPLEEGGSRKAPPELPHIIDWTCSSCGAWCNVVIDGIFGVRAGLKSITAKPEFHGLDPHSRLTNLRHQGKLYTVTKDGIRPQ